MKNLLQTITQLGLDGAVCAIITTILVGILKMPLKKIAKKSSNSTQITKYITFLPLMVGFGVISAFVYFENEEILFNQLFFTRWIGSVSASLAIYAFCEKFIPSKKKILSEAEIYANREVIREIEDLMKKTEDETQFIAEQNVVENGCAETETASNSYNAESENENTVLGKIILRGGNHAETV